MSDANMQPATSSMGNDNVMAAVASVPYIGAIMYFVMKDLKDLPKFYAKQSIGLTVLSLVLFVFSIISGFFPWYSALAFLGMALSCVSLVISLGLFIVWLVLFINALQGKKFTVPVMSDMLDKVFK